MTIPLANNSRIARPFTVPSATAPGGAASSVPVVLELEGDQNFLAHANASGTDLLVTDNAGDDVPHTMAFTRLLDRSYNAAWSHAMMRNTAAHGVYRYVGFIDVDGPDWVIGQYNETTGVWATTVLTGVVAPDADDHYNPSVCVTSDGTVLVFATKSDTGSTNGLRLFRADAPNDISSFTEIGLQSLDAGNNITYAWAHVIHSLDDLVVLFYQRSTTTRRVAFSLDNGSTWSATNLVVNVDGYICTEKDDANQLIHVVWNKEASGGDSGDLHHGYLDLTGIDTGALDPTDVTLHASDGTLINALGTASFDMTNGTIVHDVSAESTNFVGFPFDLILDDSDHPVVLFDTPTNYTSHQMRYGRWDGAAWNSYLLKETGNSTQNPGVAVGSIGYSRGAAFLDADTVFVAAEDASKVTRIYRMTTADDGENWSEEVVVHGHRNMKTPLTFHGGTSSDKLQVVWVDGWYFEYHTYLENDIACYPLAGSSCNIYAVAEVDLDGATDLTLWLQGGGPAFSRDAPFATAIYNTQGRCENKQIDDGSTELDALTGCTVLIRFNPRLEDSRAQVLVSDINPDGGLTDKAHVDFRLSAVAPVDSLRNTWRYSASTVTSTSVLEPTVNVWNAAIVAHGPAGACNFTLNGTDAAGTAGTANLETATTPSPLVVGRAANNSTTFLDGRAGGLLIFGVTKDEAWRRAATNSYSGTAGSFGAVEVVPVHHKIGISIGIGVS